MSQTTLTFFCSSEATDRKREKIINIRTVNSFKAKLQKTVALLNNNKWQGSQYFQKHDFWGC